MATASRVWTVEELWRLPPDGNRYEIVDGELFVTPTPRRVHQDAAGDLHIALQSYLKPIGIARSYMAPSDVLSGPNTLVQPDVFVVPLVDGRVPHDWNQLRQLLLAVEIISPASARADRTVKRRLYLDMGVPEYWIVDVDARLVERWRTGDSRPAIITEQLEWQPDPAHPAFVLDLPGFFAAIPEQD